jgi:hypothetical protein
MRNVPIKMTPEEIAYIGRQLPNRSEFVRRLIHQHQDMAALQALVAGLKASREKGGGSGDPSSRQDV